MTATPTSASASASATSTATATAKSTREALFTSLLLLGLDVEETFAKTRVRLSPDMFGTSNPSALRVVLHFLLSCLNPTRAAEEFRSCWPLRDSKDREKDFRKAVNGWLAALVAADRRSGLPSNINVVLNPSSSSASGERIYKYLLYLTTYVLQHSIKRLFGPSMRGPPLPNITPKSERLSRLLGKAIQAHIVREAQDYLAHTQAVDSIQRSWLRYAEELGTQYREYYEEEKRLESILGVKPGGMPSNTIPNRIVAATRNEKLMDLRHAWKVVEQGCTETEAERSLLEGVLDKNHSSLALDADAVNLRVPDSLIEQWQHRVSHGRCIDTVESRKLNLAGLIQVWNLSLRSLAAALGLAVRYEDAEDRGNPGGGTDISTHSTMPIFSGSIDEINELAQTHSLHASNVQQLRADVANLSSEIASSCRALVEKRIQSATTASSPVVAPSLNSSSLERSTENTNKDKHFSAKKARTPTVERNGTEQKSTAVKKKSRQVAKTPAFASRGGLGLQQPTPALRFDPTPEEVKASSPLKQDSVYEGRNSIDVRANVAQRFGSAETPAFRKTAVNSRDRVESTEFVTPGVTSDGNVRTYRSSKSSTNRFLTFADENPPEQVPDASESKISSRIPLSTSLAVDAADRFRRFIERQERRPQKTPNEALVSDPRVTGIDKLRILKEKQIAREKLDKKSLELSRFSQNDDDDERRYGDYNEDNNSISPKTALSLSLSQLDNSRASIVAQHVQEFLSPKNSPNFESNDIGTMYSENRIDTSPRNTPMNHGRDIFVDNSPHSLCNSFSGGYDHSRYTATGDDTDEENGDISVGSFKQFASPLYAFQKSSAALAHRAISDSPLI